MLVQRCDEISTAVILLLDKAPVHQRAMSQVLEMEWANVTECFPRAISDSWWQTISNNLRESGREAHNAEYLEKKFQELSKFREVLASVQAFTIALFFQYLNYDPRDAGFYYKNVDSFKNFANEAGLAEDSDVYTTVISLLEAASIYSTEENKLEGAYGDSDIHYFLDLDMVTLASDPENYTQHIKDISQEYSFLDPASYRSLRKRVLQSFLLIPNIFATKLFRDNYEFQARKNIQNELDELSS